MSRFECWRLIPDRPTRFEGNTAVETIKTAHAAFGSGTVAEFRRHLAAYGLTPFTTGKGYVLNIPHAPLSKLTANPLTADGKNTY